MEKGLIFAALCVAGLAAATVLIRDPWSRATETAHENVAALRAFLPNADLIAVRLAEQEAVLQAALWDDAGALLYPLPDEFSPLQRELGQSDLAEVHTFKEKIKKPSWTAFDVAGRQILYCQREPAACLVFDRGALAEQLGVKSLNSIDENRLQLVFVTLMFLVLGMSAARIWRRKPVPENLGFELFPDQFYARRYGTDIRLSKRDTKILALLEAREGAVVTRDELYDEGWGRDYMPNSRALDQHIINLRRKLDPGKDLPELIVTVRGIGYRLER